VGGARGVASAAITQPLNYSQCLRCCKGLHHVFVPCARPTPSCGPPISGAVLCSLGQPRGASSPPLLGLRDYVLDVIKVHRARVNALAAVADHLGWVGGGGWG
jgi:hypothetical protein